MEDKGTRKLQDVIQIRAAALDGIEAREVRVEATTCGDGAGIDVIGLPDTAVRESRMRIARAARRFGVIEPRRTLINLAPATLRKEGTALDLAMAVAYVAANSRQRLPRADEFLVVGELSLRGDATSLSATLPIALAARRLGVAGLVVPSAAVKRASVVAGLPVYGVRDLGDAIEILAGRNQRPSTIGRSPTCSPETGGADDLRLVKGQPLAKRALTIAAAGGHNLLMVGPPGSGKTMLARTIPGILPPLPLEQALETAAIHAVADSSREDLLYLPPFRAPHHTASRQALVGGGIHPRPGEVTLAHHGVLFLDELPEFGRDALEVLRQPLEDHEVTISRSRARCTFPADFMLIAAMNPCPCGYWGESGQRCTCTPTAQQRYRARVSGPLLDRFDMHLPVRRVEPRQLVIERPETSSAEILEQVIEARRRAACRLGEGEVNARLPVGLLERACGLTRTDKLRLVKRMEQLEFSARAYTRILRVARTIADVEQSDRVQEPHLLEAMQFRSLDRPQ